jgi:hypothetical protein
MGLYVLALTDMALDPLTVGGRTLRTVRFGPVFAICEHRRSAPVMTDETLREQHALVVESARRVDAILPVRFGAFIEKAALGTLIRQSEAEIRLGLEEVRTRVQMTIRFIGVRARVSTTPASSGREYLEARRRAATPALPPSASRLLDTLRPVVVREGMESGAGKLLATVYHLVDAAKVRHYRQLVEQIATADAVVSGPWPPFAFTPQLL